MFEGVVAGILNRFLGKYVQDLDTENLNVGIFSGNVNLTDLKLKPEALYELDLPIDVKIGTVGRVNLQIPWSGLYTQPLIVNIEDVLILVGPAISNTNFDPEREKRLMRAAKRKILQDLESESETLSGPQNFFEHLFTAIINNIQIYLRNVHIRYEDSISSKDGPLACGFCLQSLSIETTNNKWKPAVTPASATTVYQMMRVESLSVYWNPNATVLDDAETANITPMQYYNWKHYMITGLDKFSMHHEEFEFLVKPVTCKVKVIMSRSSEARVPRLLLDAVLQDSAFQLSRRQYLSLNNLAVSFQNISLNRKYRHLHPGVSVYKNIKKWWKYAYNVVIDQRVKPYTWKAIKKHRENYQAYLKTYKSTLRSPNDTELKLDLQKCEDNLPIISVVIAREQAKFELLSQEPDRIEVVESEIDWWKPSTPEESEDPEDLEAKSKVELCVKTARRKTLWSHLSSPEKKKVYELIGFVEGGPRPDKPKQYIEHKLNLTLANCSLSLMNRNKEVMVMTLTQFLVSLETRPSAKAYKLSARAEGIVIEGLNGDNDLVPMLTAERSPSTTTSHFLALDFEKNPISSEADYGICASIEPMELVYNEHAFTELINFFQTRSMTNEDLILELHSGLQKINCVSRSVLAYAVSRKKVFNINVDIRGPCIVLPEHGCAHKYGRLIVLDISRIIVKSDLQPSELALEDATCMELEEKLYDRLHAECCCQILFCDANDPWRDTRRHADSELHLVPKIRTQVVFSNSIKKDYKLLPKYKLNITISSLKLNLSDRIIGLLMDFFDNLPLPVPNTVPVSFIDSGDYVEEEASQDFQMDRIAPDPGFKKLIKLRQKLVSAYLSRNRTTESELDTCSARLGFQEADKVFASSDQSDEEMEVFARNVELPGFDDNVSPSNYIITLLRFLVGDIVINLSRATPEGDRPCAMLSVTKLCVDIALMAFGPALQISLQSILLTDKQHHGNLGQYMEVLASDPKEDVLNVLYRKVRAECPEFRTHFHSVEQALVADLGPINAILHSDALRNIASYLNELYTKIKNRSVVNVRKLVVPKGKRLWNYLMDPEADPPVPPGATKFSYSVRCCSVSMRLSHMDCNLVEIRLAGMESDCVFRANDRMILKLFLTSVHVDDLTEVTLYPKLVYPDEDKVIELKYVRHSPRVYSAAAAVPERPVKADGSVKLYVGRLHVFLIYKILHDLQQFIEPLIPTKLSTEASSLYTRGVTRQADGLRNSMTRINLDVQIHAPTLLLPQKQSSPNLLVLNTGDLLIENFFKEVSKVHQDEASPGSNPVIDNVLIKLNNITLSRAVMTLAGSLQVQEPILEPVCLRCDIKRVVGYHYVNHVRDLLLYDVDLFLDLVTINLGQRDLATIIAVYCENYSKGQYTAQNTSSFPVDVMQTDSSVEKLQNFFAQGEPVKKEIMLRFTLEGAELNLFSDMDEVLSSPVRDLNHGLARIEAGECSVQVERYSDRTLHARASLLSLLALDARPHAHARVRKIFQSHGGSTRASEGICVRCPALLDVQYRVGAARDLDIRVEKVRLNLAVPFLLQLTRTLLDAAPGFRPQYTGGVVNHGYVCDLPDKRSANVPPASSTPVPDASGATVSDDPLGLSISIQFRKPEIMFFTEYTKTEGHALLLKTELLIDYSRHSNNESLVVSLAGLQIISKLQSQFNKLPPQLVLSPCDVEYSKIFRNAEEGVRVKLSVTGIDLHLAATTVHTILDIMDEMTNELAVEEKEPFNFATYDPNIKVEEDLWSPKKITPFDGSPIEESYSQPKYPGSRPGETFSMNVHDIKILLEIERNVRVPVVLIKMTTDILVNDWSKEIHGKADLSVVASYYNERLDVWEPLLEPVVHHENTYRPWEVTAKVFQHKAYPLSCKLETNETKSETQTSISIADSKSKTKNRKTGFESETSCDEGDTDNEMTFIRNPNVDSKNLSMDMDNPNSLFLSPFGGDDSDSENENGLKDKLSTAIGLLFTDESSDDEYANEDDSSGADQSENEDVTVEEKAVSFVDGVKPGKKPKNVKKKNVRVQQPVREDSVDSGLETESYLDKLATYWVVEATHLNVTITPQSATVLYDLINSFTNNSDQHSYIMTTSDLTIVNDIGPGSTVHLVTRAETDIAGNDRILAVADYDVDTSRPSTPGDTSVEALLDDENPDGEQEDNEWDSFEGGFGSNAQCPAVDTSSLLQRLTDQRLLIKMTDFDQLKVVCPQRTVNKLHLLHPSKNNTRYYIVVETAITKYSNRKILVRSPLQIRNETSYALELYYKKTDLQAIGVDLVGEVTNPFHDKMKLALIAPSDTYNVPLYIAYHCQLFLLPSNFESYQTATQGVWWPALGSDLGTARDVLCPAKAGDDHNIFAMRILTQEGCQVNRVTRAIPNYLIRVLPPLAFYNRLPYAIEISIQSLSYRVRIEPGERSYSYILNLLKTHKVSVEITYNDVLWVGSFSLSADVIDKNLSLASEYAVEGGNKHLCVSVKVERNESWEVFLHAPYWIINKTGLPLHVKGSRSDVVYSVTETNPLLWWGRGCMGRRMRVRVHHSDWSRGFGACVGAPGLVVCAHRERATSYRLLLTVTLSELSPQLTKIITFLPYFLIYNESKRHLRYMEENEAADLWIDLAPAQCTPFWPQTDSMMLHCKFRDSTLVSQHFPITKNHFTVLRMDKGSAIAVEVTGGTNTPFVITFKPYTSGDAPVRVDNLCEDVFIKLHQIDSGQVALLSPCQSMLYTWDDPGKPRSLMWNIYNNKGKGFVADFGQDGFGEEKVSFHSVKHSPLTSTNSVTSKLSSTFKRLTPKSPDPATSSSDESDSEDKTENPQKNKKMRKDKVTVYWISYTEGFQRIYALVQDERLAYQYRMRINLEKSVSELYLSLSSASLSVCVQAPLGIKELSYISLSDSIPRWDINVSHKWKLLSPDLATWIEEKYSSNQKKCQLKEYIHIDFEKMVMTKPFFAELRRTYNPGVWLQLRKSETNTYVHAKIQRLQIDNQLNEAVFPTVLYPAPLPSNIARTDCVIKPCVELVVLKQHNPYIPQDIYKYLKVIVQEYSVNLDRGFVNCVFDILNHWKIEEKPSAKLRSDLGAIHLPLNVLVLKNQSAPGKSIVFEYVHVSPMTLVLSLSSKGYSGEETGSSNRCKFGNHRENRPKLFNSDLLEYLFNSWGSSLCDMKDVKIRMSHLELRQAPVHLQGLMAQTSQHYWTQLVQQFYVFILGLKILGNPYSNYYDFSRGLKEYCSVFNMSPESSSKEPISVRLRSGIAALLGHCAGATPGMFSPPRIETYGTAKHDGLPPLEGNDLPLSLIEASKSHQASVALTLGGLITIPTFGDGRAIRKAWRNIRGDIVGAVRSSVERSGGRLIARRRLPRHCRSPEGLQPYSSHCAIGLELLRRIARGHYADTDLYLAHCYINNYVLLLTTQHIFLVRGGAGSAAGTWNVEWGLALDDLIGVPSAEGKTLQINVRQNELVNFFATDEKTIEFPDEEVLQWMRDKIECALILNLEDKPCSQHM